MNHSQLCGLLHFLEHLGLWGEKGGLLVCMCVFGGSHSGLGLVPNVERQYFCMLNREEL